MSIGKTIRFRRFVALILVFASLLSHLVMGVSAEPNTDQTVYCGQTDHEHTEECYIAPVTESADPTEETTEAAEETTEATEETTEVTEATEETTEVQQAPNTDEVAMRLLATTTVEELYDLLYEQGYIYSLEEMSANELAALDAHADQLYDPQQDDFSLYEMIKDGIGSFTGVYEDNDAKILVDVSGNVPGYSITSDTEWNLTGDVTINQRINIVEGVTLTITGSGKITQTNSNTDIVGILANNAKLVVKGDAKDSITLSGGSSGLYVRNDRTVTIDLENTILENCADGPIYIQASASGQTTKATVTLTNSTIRNGNVGTANVGGAVLVKSGSECVLTMNNSAITNCANGAIYVASSAKLDLKINNSTISACNQNAVYVGSWSECELSIDGSTISECDGSAVQIGAETTFYLKIQNSTIENCKTVTGAGVNFEGKVKGVAEISHTIFRENKTSQGGVIRTGGNSGVTLKLNQCVFKKNSANNQLFAGNTAGYTNGAAIYWNACGYDVNNQLSSITITDCQFIENTVEFSGASLEDGHGGAIYNEAFMTITSKFTSNFTLSEATPGNICGNLIKGNTTTNYGGGIMVPTYAGGMKGHEGYGAALTLDESVFVINNRAARGGGIAMSVGEGSVGGEDSGAEYTLTCDGATIRNNTASQMGGGIYLEREKDKDCYPSTVDLLSGIVSDNTAPKGGAICVYNASNAFSTKKNEVNIGGIHGELIIENNHPEAGKFENSAGGAIYISYGNANIFNGILRNNKAQNGGAITVVNGQFTMSGGTIVNNNAHNGGAIYVTGNGARCTINGGIVGSNVASNNGGGVYIAGGDFTMSGGVLGATGNVGNTAVNGGGVYTDGGNVHLKGGSLVGNTAAENGGAIAVYDGDIIMSGGTVSNNQAETGSGGGLYVSAPAGKAVTVKVFSGTLSDNTAATSGGAVGVNGLEGSTINVQIGVKENHYENGALKYGFTHDGGYVHLACPVVKNNHATQSGGAFYINAAEDSTTNLDIFCSEDEGNSVDRDIDPVQKNDDHPNGKQLSSYLMVEGGKVIISTSKNNVLEGGYTKPDDDIYGYLQVKGTVHVVSGELEIFGSMDNPSFEDYLTIDLQKEGDKYVDHRVSKSKVKVSYHENFKDADGNPDSTQTAFDIVSGNVHRIETGLYGHDGYELVGWNIDPNATAGVTETGWYTPGKEFTFYNPDDPDKPAEGDGIQIGDLTLYAIWKINGYTINFDPGVDAGDQWWGSVDSISCSYAAKVQLRENGFVYPGHIFAGWKLGDKVYQPGDEVSKLTDKNADVVTFVAQWTACNHQGECTYTVNDDGDTITKTCTVCQLSATAKLTAEDAVYDTTSHPAVLECSNPDFWNPAISYSGTKIGKSESVLEPEKCINAGNYTAAITGGDVTATATFTIAKADQTVPDEIPTYEHPKGEVNGKYELKINQIASAKRTSDVPTQATEVAPKAEYLVRYYDGETPVDTYYKGDTTDNQVVHDLKASLTTYSVYVRYEETDNYNPSDLVSAEMSFYFSDNLILNISADEGINYKTSSAENSSLKLYVTLQDGYYLLNELGGTDPFDLKISETDKTFLDIATVGEGTQNQYYTIVGKNLPSEGVTTVYLHIGTTRKKGSIQSSAKEKEHFNNFTGSAAITIARDSAFTVLYTVTGYYKDDFNVPVLTFSEALPAGTTIILRDRSDESYWYYKFGSAADSVSLGSFTKMGASQTGYTVADGDLKLQFIVDFSKASSPLTDDPLKCALSMAKKSGGDVISSTVTVSLSGVSYSMTAPTTQSLKVDIGVGAAASRYDHRDLALVLNPTVDLPIDAEINVKMGSFEATYRPNQNGKIIILLGDFKYMSETIELKLSSRMFPMEVKTYTMNAALYLSRTDAESAPLNGTPLVSNVLLSFTSVREATGIDVFEATDKRIYTNASGEKITVHVDTKEVAQQTQYTITVQLHEEQNGVYVNTAKPYQNSGDGYTFDLSGLRKGNYCVVATLSDANGYVVAESRYYIIVKPSETQVAE